jgi:hypothetical protein
MHRLSQVLSSIIAAWSDVSSVVPPAVDDAASSGGVVSTVYRLNVGYLWMLLNCITSAAYVSALLESGLRKAEWLMISTLLLAGVVDAEANQDNWILGLGHHVL